MVQRERRLTYGSRRAAQKCPETIIAAIADAIGIPDWTGVDPRIVCTYNVLRAARWTILGLLAQRSNPKFAQTILGLSELEVCAQHVLLYNGSHSTLIFSWTINFQWECLVSVDRW